MTIKNALRDVNNAVLDLQNADHNTFERPLKRLTLALNSDDLKQFTDELRSKADLDKFLENSDQGGSMLGSARLNWPADKQEGLSLALQIIERSAQNPEWFLKLACTYYYSGNKIAENIRKITAAVIIPFNRDFSVYVDEYKSELSTSRSENGMSSEADKEELLESLFKLEQTTKKRPSIEGAGLKYLPEWKRDRLYDAAVALEKDGAILNHTGASYVDISSTSRRRMEQKLSVAAQSGTTINIASMNQSPFQFNSEGANGVQTTSYSTNDLQSVVELYRKHVDEFELDNDQRRRANAQVATIEAQLIDEPNPTIIEAAGRSLKTILEGAIGSAAGNALASSPLWMHLLSLFG